MNKIDQT